MFNKKGQVAIEVLVIIGIVILGAVIFGIFFINNQANYIQKSDGLTETTGTLTDQLDYTGESAPSSIVCGNGICEPGETSLTCLDCECEGPDCGDHSDICDYVFSEADCNADTCGCTPTCDNFCYTCQNINNINFSPEGGEFPAGTLVSLAHTEDLKCKDYQIHYTIDNTEPTELSPIYSLPLILTKDTNITAKVFAKNLLNQEVFGESNTENYIVRYDPGFIFDSIDKNTSDFICQMTIKDNNGYIVANFGDGNIVKYILTPNDSIKTVQLGIIDLKNGTSLDYNYHAYSWDQLYFNIYHNYFSQGIYNISFAGDLNKVELFQYNEDNKFCEQNPIDIYTCLSWHKNTRNAFDGNLLILSQSFPNLKELILKNTVNTGNISELSSLNSLERLELLTTPRIQGNFQEISNLTNLKYLKLWSVDINGNIESLRYNTKLEQLYIIKDNKNQIFGSLNQLNNLPLKQIVLSNINEVTYNDVNFSNLEEFSLSPSNYNPQVIFDFNSFNVGNNFNKLTLNQVVVNNLSSIYKFTNLEELLIHAKSGSPDLNLSYLSNLINLRYLYLYGEFFGNINNLYEFNNLRCFKLNGTIIYGNFCDINGK